MSMACFFPAYWNGYSFDVFSQAQFDHQRGTLVSLQTGVQVNVEVLGLYKAMQLVRLDPFLSFLALRCLLKID